MGHLRIFLCLFLVALSTACETVEKAKPKPSSAKADRTIPLDVPQIMRGTVASEAVLVGFKPIVARGYGLVVGLNGTGSRDEPAVLRQFMISEMARQGIGSEQKGFGHLKPEAMLDSLNTAVVIVEAIIPPAAIKGTRFDLRVYAHPMTSTTSLEGGQLYTTELRPVVTPGLPPVGSRQANALGEGGGPVFVNPFAGPAGTDVDNIDRTYGRVLNGGSVLKDIPIKLRLTNPSHNAAYTLQNAIQARFPQESGQMFPTARGESDEAIEITVPPSYRDHTFEFIELLRHTSLYQGAAESTANSVKRIVIANPGDARAAAWRWQALGVRALPIIKEMYDYSEEQPRLAALQAGARLSDPLVVPSLIELARSGSTAARKEAIDLMGRMDVNPAIDIALRRILNDENVDIRLAAYDASIKRRDPLLQRERVDNRFMIDVVESDKPTVYIAQFGQPRIVIFGRDLSISQPLTSTVWPGRLLIKGDSGEADVEVFFRDEETGQSITNRVKPNLVDFVRFLGHTSTIERPQPGLSLSYGQTVGVLHRIWRQGYLSADFKAEQDRLLAQILDQEREQAVIERPEFADEILEFDPELPEGTGPTSPASDLDRLEPIVPPPAPAEPAPAREPEPAPAPPPPSRSELPEPPPLPR